MGMINYIVVFKDKRIHAYSLKSERRFLNFIQELETEIIFKIKDETDKVIEKSEEITRFCLDFVVDRIEKDVLINLFQKFVFDKNQKDKFSWLTSWRNFKL